MSDLHKKCYKANHGTSKGICDICLMIKEKRKGELRKRHDKKYNYDGDGVVNPAILTIE